MENYTQKLFIYIFCYGTLGTSGLGGFGGLWRFEHHPTDL